MQKLHEDDQDVIENRDLCGSALDPDLLPADERKLLLGVSMAALVIDLILTALLYQYRDLLPDFGKAVFEDIAKGKQIKAGLLLLAEILFGGVFIVGTFVVAPIAIAQAIFGRRTMLTQLIVRASRRK